MKKIPLRRCLATGESLPKESLIRIVKGKDGNIFIDLTSKANGRGAYLKPSLEAVEKAIKTNCLGRALDAKIDPKIYDELKSIIERTKN